MPLFMDVRNVEGGVSAADVAGAHEADLATQGTYGVNYLRYWVDEEAGKIFCLVEAGGSPATASHGRSYRGSRCRPPGGRARLAVAPPMDAARAMPLLREPCPRSTEWRGPPSSTSSPVGCAPLPARG
jgi:Protein of unknown function (DUF4242)